MGRSVRGRRCGEVCVRGRRCGEVCVRGRRCGEVLWLHFSDAL